MKINKIHPRNLPVITAILACLFWNMRIAYGQQVPLPLTSAEQGFQWNPAMTGLWNDLDVRAHGVYQWLGYAGAPQTYTVSVQNAWEKLHMAGGVQIILDKTGPLTWTGGLLSYRYGFQPGLTRRDRLHAGISVGLGSYGWNQEKAIVIEGGDPLVTGKKQSGFDYVVSAGLFYDTEDGSRKDETHIFGGIAFQKVIPHDVALGEANNRQSMHLQATGGLHVVGSTFYFDHLAQGQFVAPGLYNISYNFRCELPDVFYAGLYANTALTFGLQGGLILGANNPAGHVRCGVMGLYNVGATGRYQGFTPSLEVAWVKEL